MKKVTLFLGILLATSSLFAESNMTGTDVSLAAASAAIASLKVKEVVDIVKLEYPLVSIDMSGANTVGVGRVGFIFVQGFSFGEMCSVVAHLIPASKVKSEFAKANKYELVSRYYITRVENDCQK